MAFLLVLALLLLTFYARENDKGLLHQSQKLVLAISAPLQTGVTYLVQPFSNFWSYVRDITRLRADNRRLRKEVTSLKRQVVDLEEMSRENKRLQGLLGLKDDLDYTFLAAPVIGKEASGWQSVVEIGRGSNSGVKKDSPAVSDKGVVGKVAIVTGNAALVQLIDDSRSGVSAQIQKTGEVGVVSGNLEGELRLRFVKKDSPLKKGDVVITSGLGGVYPKGLLLGSVDEISSRPYSLYKEVTVKAAADFSGLEEVMIITNAPGPSPFSKDGEQSRSD